ncbi:MAG: DMSO/selenate family reductase complex A subunit [Desulfitobacteriia bacterium]
MSAKLSRRSFLKLGAGVVAGTSVLGYGLTSGFGSSLVPVKADDSGEEKIVSLAGSHNCGGRCVVKAHVKDNIVVRITSDNEADDDKFPQLRGCLRCRSYRQRLYHPDRLKYPMKRVGKRGEGQFEQITWDEATTTIANELKRITSQYGPEAIYWQNMTGDSAILAERNFAKRLLGLNGGYLNQYNNYSTACTHVATPYTYGTTSTGNSFDSLLYSKLIILWGHNPAETVFSTNTPYILKKARDAGAKIIVIDPRYSDTAALLADEWIPILPTTDNALMDAMIYVMITEGLYDKEFVAKYCLGFDEDQMPEGIPAGNSLKSYIIGVSDGVPKTPEWAEKICRVPAGKIRQLAREYATIKPAALVQGWAPQRHAYGEQPVRGATVLASITGNVGILGGWASGSAYWGRTKVAGLPAANPVKTAISMFMWTEAIERGKEMTAKDGVTGAERLSTDIKMIFNVAGNTLINQHSDINNTVRILQDESKCEFILVAEQFMTPSAKFADILLPADMYFEREDITTPWIFGDYVLYQGKAADPPFECRNGYDWMTEVADKLGFKDKFTEGRTRQDWVKYIVEQTRLNHPEFPTYEEFKERGVYKWRFPEPLIAFKQQIEDPANNPFPTPSGKIEIFSQRLYEMNNPEIPAIPKYIESWEGPADPLREKYPLQCFGWHYKASAHSTFHNINWLQEAQKHCLWINPMDAEARGIKNGDRVRVFNERGEIEIEARVTVRIMPGVVAMPEGAWYTPDSTGVDKGGCINTLTKYHPTPLAKGNPQHTNLVEVKKA